MALPLSVLDLSPVGAGRRAEPGDPRLDRARGDGRPARLHALLVRRAPQHGEHRDLGARGADRARGGGDAARIRVGAGGIMVPNHSPLHVVEVFRTLEALHPGRIDLGLGRAPGTDPVTSAALRRSDDPEVNHLLAELLAFERGGVPRAPPVLEDPADAVRRAAAVDLDARLDARRAPRSPRSSACRTRSRATSRCGRRATRSRTTRAASSPRRSLAAPYAMLAVTAVCGCRRRGGRAGSPRRCGSRSSTAAPAGARRSPSIEDALAYRFSPRGAGDRRRVLRGRRHRRPARSSRSAFDAVAREIGADEMMLSTLVPSLDERRASLERTMTAVRAAEREPALPAAAR